VAIAPLVSICTIGWSSRPARILACAISDPADSSASHDTTTDSDESSPAANLQESQADRGRGEIILSINPSTPSVTSTEPPVIFPGYVLPADSLEDRAHAGN
jgi:hypothetical protein